MRYFGVDPGLNKKFMCVSYIPYTCHLKVISYTMFSVFMFEIRCGIFHLWCHGGAQQISNFGGFLILDFWTGDVQVMLTFVQHFMC
jgi:hypothetical protein